MFFELPILPYKHSALAPNISEETLDYHYGKHHKAYVDTLNKLVEGSKWEAASLDEIVKGSDGNFFNQAGQHWNHSFYWNCMSPGGGGQPGGTLGTVIEQAFGSFEEFAEQFTKKAVGTFGSGWVWLVKKNDSNLEIVSTQNADNPTVNGQVPLLTCDVWEHAYYIDYRNARKKYVDAFLEVIDWPSIEKRFSS